MKRKYLPLFMAVLMLGSSLSVSAAETQDVGKDEVTAGTSKGTDVFYEEASDFIVTIPKAIALSSVKTADYSISVKGSVKASESVSVTPEDDYADAEGINFAMHETNGYKSDILANITQADTVWSCAEITVDGTAKTGSVSAEDLTAGSWSGNVTFDINVTDEATVHVHSYTESVTKAATCTETGVKTFTCECGDNYTEDISATGHSFASEYTVDVAATCTTAGSKSQHCANCDAVQNVTEIAATGHNYGTAIYSWSSDGKTCTATRTCLNDSSHVETENGTITSVVKTAPTSTAKGITTYTAVFGNSAFATQTKDVQDINELATMSLKHGISGSDFPTNASLVYGGSSSSARDYFKVVSNSSGAITVSSNSSAVSVGADSFTGGYKITANSAGSAVITITQAADENYSETSLKLNVTVTQHVHTYEYNKFSADWEYHYETCAACGQESGNYGAHDRLGPDGSCSVCGYSTR